MYFLCRRRGLYRTLKLAPLLVKMGKISYDSEIFFASICQRKYQEKSREKKLVFLRMSIKNISLIIVQRFHFVKTCISYVFFLFHSVNIPLSNGWVYKPQIQFIPETNLACRLTALKSFF